MRRVLAKKRQTMEKQEHRSCCFFHELRLEELEFTLTLSHCAWHHDAPFKSALNDAVVRIVRHALQYVRTMTLLLIDMSGAVSTNR